MDPQPSSPSPELGTGPRSEWRRRARWFWFFLIGLLLAFAPLLVSLVRLSLHSELYSHLLFVPVISAYLVWTDRSKLSLIYEPVGRLAGGLFLSGLIALAGYGLALAKGWHPASENDRLCLLTLAAVLIFSGGVAACFGGRIWRGTGFALAFLLFMVPWPQAFEEGLTENLQQASAITSYWFLTWSGMPVFRQGTELSLPGVNLGVAPECSGIHSTLVLFMVGILAAYFLLRRPWSRLVLATLLIPLGIARNAFRIFTLAQLAVKVNPDILNSDLHHRGGPLFFAVSLVPFFLLIWLLRKGETRLNKSRPQ